MFKEDECCKRTMIYNFNISNFERGSPVLYAKKRIEDIDRRNILLLFFPLPLGSFLVMIKKSLYRIVVDTIFFIGICRKSEYWLKHRRS